MLPKHACLKHIALKVNNLEACESFYHKLGLKTELKIDDYVYLTGNGDNISLHRVDVTFLDSQRLEHFGFALNSVEAVNTLFEKIKKSDIAILHPPKTFGIGTHSFSVLDPEGNEIEFTFHPPMWSE
jgi:catechol 2,3-dioxygenase-like lactoylglutathione lyase family enzyme